MSMREIDPITLEVIRNALASTADEMALIVMRSAYSPVVRDIMDYSTALCDAKGRVIAQGLTLPIQLCSFPRIMGFVKERYGDMLKPGTGASVLGYPHRKIATEMRAENITIDSKKVELR